MQMNRRSTSTRKPSEDSYNALFQGGDQSNVQQTYNMFQKVIDKCNAEKDAQESHFKQQLIPQNQVMNLLESITGSYKFESPRVEQYTRGFPFQKTAKQEKILYSNSKIIRKARQLDQKLQ